MELGKLSNMLLRKLQLLICLLAMTSAVCAESLQGIYQMAHESDPGLRAADAARRATGEASPQALAGLLPSVNLGGSYSRDRFDPRSSGNTTYATNQTYTLSLNQPIYRFDRIIQYRQADNLVAQAEAEYASAEQALMLRVAERYFDALSAQDNVRFAQANQDAISRQLDQAQQRFEVGLIAIIDVHEAQAQYDLAVTTVIRAEDQLESALEALREVTGQRHSHLAVLVSEIKLSRPDPDNQQAWVDTALQQNLSLTAAKAGVEAAQKEIARQRAGHRPTVDLTASYSYRDNSFGGVIPQERNDTAIGVEFNLPLYQGGLVSSRTRAARNSFDEARERLEEQHRIIERQTRDAYRGVITSISEVKAQAQAVVSTKTALQAAETGFEVGTRTIVEVLNAQRERLLSERDYLRSRYDYLVNGLRLKQAAGTLAGGDLSQIDQWLK